jgi:2-amino-4-hydroxy-6-hydroxymethyldihydropteridine diphosphokinase
VILIALGANLPGANGAAPKATCEAAAVALDTIQGVRRVALSRWWLTAPVPPSAGAPWYVNGVARCEGDMEPGALLRALQALEDAAGRQRPYPNAPRTLDLDIIAMGALVRAAPDPILPHPRAHLRRFVLQPLSEVAPEWRHPLLGQTATELMRDLPEDGMQAL